MKNCLLLQIILFSYFILLSNTIFAQGWERNHGGDFDDAAYHVSLTNDGGYLVTGTTDPNGSTVPDMYVLKLDANGDTSWTRSMGVNTQSDDFWAGHQTNDGGFFAAGTSLALGGMSLVKMDAQGDTTWTRTYSNAYYCRSAIQTADQGYLMVGAGATFAQLLKVDSMGAYQWDKSYGGAQQEVLEAVEQTPDGGYIMAGKTQSFGNFSQMYLIRTDANGDTLWTNTYGESNIDEAWGLDQTSDGGFILVGKGTLNSVSGILVVKTDAAGLQQWARVYEGSNAFGIRQTTDGGYIIGGATLLSNALLIKTDMNGDTTWTKSYQYGQARQVEQTPDGGYVFAGNGPQQDVYVVKTDALGNSFTNYIQGNVFQDNNNDCALNAGDVDLSGYIIAATHNGNGIVYYGTTDNNGYYNILCENGTYTVSVINPIPYYATPCGQNITANVPNILDIDTINFALDPTVLCPQMTVDISAPFIRQTGGGSFYTITYCNNGTVDANNVYIEVEFDASLNIVSSSIPVGSQAGNIFTYNIGTVGLGQCASFDVNVLADTSAILGQAFCTEAHIYPDSLCLPSPWNGANLRVDASCQNDTVFFSIQNIGAQMVQPSAYYVYEDNIIFRQGQTPLLGNLASNLVTVAADPGKAYRLVVQQEFNFPAILGDSVATAVLEGCNPLAGGTFNTGFVTNISNGNSSPFIAIDCQQMIASVDPNDKSAQPEGYGSQHYIDDWTALDYKIRFQNTGNDTAFLVVIRDTISPYLDISSIEMGASSHPYTWRIYGNGILEMTFASIHLPDSNVNEAASHGFVRYRINQTASNPIGTVINNTAGIYFDYNAPIVTNTTFHTVGEDFVQVNVSIDKIFAPNVDVRVYPNPFRERATLKVEGKDYAEMQLSIFDALGRLMEYKEVYGQDQIQIERGKLQTGLYLYRLEGDGQLINTGKILVD